MKHYRTRGFSCTNRDVCKNWSQACDKKLKFKWFGFIKYVECNSYAIREV